MTERSCYCGLWETSPETLERQSIPRGYCGVCDVCKRPGHTRHFPGPVPYTGSWCDRHYRCVAWTHPLTPVGRIVWLSVVAGIGVLVWWMRTRHAV